MHNAFININNQKMSKSLGNFFTVRDITAKYDPMVLRFYMLSAHYRNPLNFSKDLMDSAKTSFERIMTALDRARELAAKATAAGDVSVELTLNTDKAAAKTVTITGLLPGEDAVVKSVDEQRQIFESKMEDDLNTADAITAIFEIVRLANVSITDQSSKALDDYVVSELTTLLGVLGIRTEKKEDTLDSEIEKLIEERQAARKAKDFKKADEIRDTLLAKGIILKDTREGVKWSRA
jgi:cysteinyl-tRNA synthetase